MAAQPTDVIYNSYSFLGKTGFVPFVSLSNDYVQVGGGTWVIKHNISLMGTLANCDRGELIKQQNEMVQALSVDFKQLDISGFEDPFTVPKVISIDFNESPVLTNIDYSITIECYDLDSFASAYRVIEPTETVEFVEDENRTMTKTVTISAKGIRTSSSPDALQNAKDFVEGQFDQKGTALTLRPAFISSEDAKYGTLLISTSEEINRIEGTYSKTQTFRSNLESKDGSSLFKYTREFVSEQGEYLEIQVEGSVVYGLFDDAAARTVARDNARDKIEVFVGQQKEAGYRVLSLDFDEDSRGGETTFSLRLTEDLTDVVDDYTVTVEQNAESSLVSVTVNGTVTAKGPKECRWLKVSRYFYGPTYTDGIYEKKLIYGRANTHYPRFLTRNTLASTNSLGHEVILNEWPLSKEVTEDHNNGVITYNFTFNDRMQFIDSEEFFDFDYNFKATPSSWKVVSSPNVDGSWSILDLGYKNRFKYSIQGYTVGPPLSQTSGRATTNAINSRSFIEQFSHRHLTEKFGEPEKLWKEEEGLQTDEGPGRTNAPTRASFSYLWSFHSNEHVTAGRDADEWVTPLKDGVLGYKLR